MSFIIGFAIGSILVIVLFIWLSGNVNLPW